MARRLIIGMAIALALAGGPRPGVARSPQDLPDSGTVEPGSPSYRDYPSPSPAPGDKPDRGVDEQGLPEPSAIFDGLPAPDDVSDDDPGELPDAPPAGADNPPSPMEGTETRTTSTPPSTATTEGERSPAVPTELPDLMEMKVDPEVVPAATAPAQDVGSPPPGSPAPESTATAGATAPETEGGGLADVADRLREGPRSVGVTVDAVAPAAFNINLPMRVVITVRNDGQDDVFDVVVRDPLPDGLEFIEASPPPDANEDGGRTLVWRWGSIPSGAERTIELQVKPVRSGPIDHVPLVDFRTAAKARTTVLEPKLKVEQTAPNGEILKGETFDFNVTVTNTGNGPARAVELIATLSGGLQGYDDSGQPTSATRFSKLIGDLGPNESFGPIPLPVVATATGMQFCEVQAISGDVVPDAPAHKSQINVVSPQLTMTVEGPPERTVGSMGEYVITITNNGTTAAKEVAIGAFLPLSGTPEVPPDAQAVQDLDKGVHKIYWRLPRLDKGESKQYRLPVRLNRIQDYLVQAAANAQGPRERIEKVEGKVSTRVTGFADVQIVDVNRRDPVIDVGAATEFEIRIKNMGTEAATNVQVDFIVSELLKVEQTDVPAKQNPNDPTQNGFELIDRLAPGAERVFGVRVRAQKPGVADFRVKVSWDGLPEEAAVPSGNIVKISSGSTEQVKR